MGNKKKSGAKQVLQRVFWSVYLALVMILPLLLSLVDHWLFAGRFNLGGYGGALAVPMMLISALVARQVCRRRGLSLDGQQIEIIRRGEKNSCAESAHDAASAFEMKAPRSLLLWVGVMSALFFVAGLAAWFFLPDTLGKLSGILLAAMFGWFTLWAALAHFHEGESVGRVDERGVKGYHRFGLTMKFVTWKDIASCEVTVLHDVLGNLTHPFFVFKNHDGRVLLKMMMNGTPATQTEPFKAAIAQHLSA